MNVRDRGVVSDEEKKNTRQEKEINTLRHNNLSLRQKIKDIEKEKKEKENYIIKVEKQILKEDGKGRVSDFLAEQNLQMKSKIKLFQKKNEENEREMINLRKELEVCQMEMNVYMQALRIKEKDFGTNNVEFKAGLLYDVAKSKSEIDKLERSLFEKEKEVQNLNEAYKNDKDLLHSLSENESILKNKLFEESEKLSTTINERNSQSKIIKNLEKEKEAFLSYIEELEEKNQLLSKSNDHVTSSSVYLALKEKYLKIKESNLKHESDMNNIIKELEIYKREFEESMQFLEEEKNNNKINLLNMKNDYEKEIQRMKIEINNINKKKTNNEIKKKTKTTTKVRGGNRKNAEEEYEYNKEDEEEVENEILEKEVSKLKCENEALQHVLSLRPSDNILNIQINSLKNELKNLKESKDLLQQTFVEQISSLRLKLNKEREYNSNQNASSYGVSNHSHHQNNKTRIVTHSLLKLSINTINNKNRNQDNEETLVYSPESFSPFSLSTLNSNNNHYTGNEEKVNKSDERYSYTSGILEKSNKNPASYTAMRLLGTTTSKISKSDLKVREMEGEEK